MREFICTVDLDVIHLVLMPSGNRFTLFHLLITKEKPI